MQRSPLSPPHSAPSSAPSTPRRCPHAGALGGERHGDAMMSAFRREVDRLKQALAEERRARRLLEDRVARMESERSVPPNPTMPMNPMMMNPMMMNPMTMNPMLEQQYLLQQQFALRQQQEMLSMMSSRPRMTPPYAGPGGRSPYSRPLGMPAFPHPLSGLLDGDDADSDDGHGEDEVIRSLRRQLGAQARPTPLRHDARFAFRRVVSPAEEVTPALLEACPCLADDCAVCLEPNRASSASATPTPPSASEAAPVPSSGDAPSPVAVLPCGHAFHEGCVRDWLVRSRRCPVCRAAVSVLPAH